ncbi:flagellar motor switch protein FliN [Sphingomonas sp. TREG-RG-20F-R18-01]|uniref:flagellar motor switch protein FliN n=1 Tax=Sphingomonas sp. TREG-RG-20F-R18-01 TaxID=2914982 RepID=UPI001F5684F9|nr:flagellar motor switch protein FliN [Sphingomonas sp. TREG-RG-20F-R18-01]
MTDTPFPAAGVDAHDLPMLADTPEDAASPVYQPFDDLPPARAQATPTGLEAVHEVPVKVQAVLGRAQMPVGDLLGLCTGMVFELDRRVGEPVDVFVNDRLVARGEVVLVDHSLGVTLTEIVRAGR